MRTLTTIILISVVSACSSIKLKRAERLIAKAVAQGAKVTNDTVYAPVTFKAPPMTFTTKLDKFRWGDTLYVRGKDGEAKIITQIKKLPGTHRVDTVVRVECPEQQVEKKVPIEIDREIKAGYTFWNLLFWFFVGLVVGAATYFILRVIKILP